MKKVANPMVDPVLSVRNLTTEFRTSGGVVRAVDGVNFDLFAGETLGIVGESGSGKSVTVLSALGLIPRDAGKVVAGTALFQGRDLLAMPPDQLRKIRGGDIAMVFQDPMTSLNPVFTVGAQLSEALTIHDRRLPRAAVRKRAVEVLAKVGIPNPEQRYDQYPHEFSGGMRQRAMIAMAMINDPEVLIADEPTTALDVTIQAQVLQVLRKAQRETHSAAILITHDLGVVAETADRVLVMYGGRVVESGTVDQIFHAPRHPYTAGLLRSMPSLGARSGRLIPIPGDPPHMENLPEGCSFQPRCALSKDRSACHTSVPLLEPTDVVDHLAACHFHEETASLDPVGDDELTAVTPHPAALAARETVLEVEGLVKHFQPRRRLLRRRSSPVKAVEGVDLYVRAGETLGLVGESGSGKSTLGRAVIGLVSPSGGRVAFLGRDVAEMDRNELRQSRRDLQIVFQDPYASLDPKMKVSALVAEPLRIHGGAKGPEGRARVADLLARVGLPARFADRYPHQLSGGQRQRVGIARALALQPQVIILDEPVSALDVSVQAQVINLLEELQDDLGLAYLFIAHDLSVVNHVSDRVAVMYLGKIMEEGPRAAIYESPTHPYTQSLLSAVPIADPRLRDRGGSIVLKGDIPNPADPPSGCVFRTRCWKADSKCATEVPLLADRLGIGHPSACHYPEVMNMVDGRPTAADDAAVQEPRAAASSGPAR